ncbi:MAG: carbonic anhydrase [Rhodospirillales bacterium]|nr:carbonic anhydrase [Rhodospirillales bacterium]
MDYLIEGYRRFRETEWPARRARFEELARDGQSPRALVIACSDSRVDPSLIFHTGPGEIFIIRNVANLVPTYAPDGQGHGTSAAIEFAVRVLEVPEVIVLGHAMCGGIQALLHGAPSHASDFLLPWITVAEPAIRRVLACAPADPQTACENEAVRESLGNLMTFPWIAERVSAGTLKLSGMSFDVRSGILTRMGQDGVFSPV